MVAYNKTTTRPDETFSGQKRARKDTAHRFGTQPNPQSLTRHAFTLDPAPEPPCLHFDFARAGAPSAGSASISYLAVFDFTELGAKVSSIA
jgi:hypothetical protein